uniref:Uncharacterized protein n=1 Tax=Lactuca sativa TaxID=4236 RepID=A0A9R1V6U9_LACSA|nr:hypothetical protein LSAT_V11C600323280 [Lactuca sativa]
MNNLQEMNIGIKIYLKDIEHITDDSPLKARATKYQSCVFSQKFSRFRNLIKECESYIILKPNMAAVKNGFNVTGQRRTITLDCKSSVKNVMIFRSS